MRIVVHATAAAQLTPDIHALVVRADLVEVVFVDREQSAGLEEDFFIRFK